MVQHVDLAGSIPPMVQHVDLAGDRDTGFKQVADRACDVQCRHISGWIVVLVDQEESRLELADQGAISSAVIKVDLER